MRRLRELLLWAGAALGLLAVATGLAVAFFGFSFLLFRSGSMSPEIPTGGVALSRTVAAADLAPGDVVSVVAGDGERITHRIVSSTLRGDEASLVLQGDANTTADSEIYVVTSAERVVASVPYGGYVLSHALTPPGLLAVGCLSVMLLLLTFGRGDEDDVPGSQRPRGRPRHRAAASPRTTIMAGTALLVALGGAGTVVAAEATGTWARFDDRASAASGTSSALTMTAPAPTCIDNGASVTLTFPVVAHPGRTVAYDASLSNATPLPVGGTGPTRSVTITSQQAPGVLFGTRDYVVTVTARTTTAPVWTSTSRYAISTFGTVFVNMACDGPA